MPMKGGRSGIFFWGAANRLKKCGCRVDVLSNLKWFASMRMMQCCSAGVGP